MAKLLIALVVLGVAYAVRGRRLTRMSNATVQFMYSSHALVTFEYIT